MKHEDHDEDAEFTAAISVLAGAWKVAQQFGVCPACLVYTCAAMVEEAVDEGRVHHGVLPKDAEFTHVVGKETMQ